MDPFLLWGRSAGVPDVPVPVVHPVSRPVSHPSLLGLGWGQERGLGQELGRGPGQEQGPVWEQELELEQGPGQELELERGPGWEQELELEQGPGQEQGQGHPRLPPRTPPRRSTVLGCATPSERGGGTRAGCTWPCDPWGIRRTSPVEGSALSHGRRTAGRGGTSRPVGKTVVGVGTARVVATLGAAVSAGVARVACGPLALLP